MEKLLYIFTFLALAISATISIILLLAVKILKEYLFISSDDKQAFKKANPQYMTFCSVFYPIFFSMCVVMFLGFYEEFQAIHLNQLSITAAILMSIFFLSGSIMGINAISLMFRYNMWPFRLKRPILKPRKQKPYVHENSDLISQFLIKKDNENLVAFVTLWTSFLVLFYRYFRTPEISTLVLMLVTGSLFVLNILNQKIIHYRVKYGLYGTCYLEAKEIIAYVLEWQRENGNSNGKPPKLVFTQEELDQCLQVNGSEEYAG